MMVLRLITLSGLALAWYGYHVEAASIFGSGLLLLVAPFALRGRDHASKLATLAAPAALASTAEPPKSPPPLRDVDAFIDDVSAKLKAARDLRSAQERGGA